MITARPAARSRSREPHAATVGEPPCPSRHSRRQERRRKVREQLLIGLVLLVLLIVTVVLLGLQWLDSSNTVTSSLGVVTLTGGVPT
jgi:predicted nucleic acid-binding Zn ribbon protein